ncbi:hypothetical protein B0T17DRAFT_544231 [Bombardia bombarda]|uniref:Uncharacterized protein n=1 Tax=Bombardia bombarda TaxID=252184 RepID=A0AA39TU89_9PEZI|nr:hypothetical protein B0T17DRAFT_544231 [Bombardia bombarda]
MASQVHHQSFNAGFLSGLVFVFVLAQCVSDNNTLSPPRSRTLTPTPTQDPTPDSTQDSTQDSTPAPMPTPASTQAPMPTPASTQAPMPTLASTQAASSEDGDATTPKTICLSPDEWSNLIKSHPGEGKLIREVWWRSQPAHTYDREEKRWVQILDLRAVNRALDECQPSVELKGYHRDWLTEDDLERYGRPVKYFDWETFRAIAAMYVRQDVASFELWEQQEQDRKEKRERELDYIGDLIRCRQWRRIARGPLRMRL